MRLSLLGLLLLAAVAVAWPVGAGAQAKVCAGHPKDPSVVCARDSAHIVDICDRAADGHRVFARVVTKSTYPAYRVALLRLQRQPRRAARTSTSRSQVVSIQTCVQKEGCGAVRATGVSAAGQHDPATADPHPRADPGAHARSGARHRRRRRPARCSSASASDARRAASGCSSRSPSTSARAAPSRASSASSSITARRRPREAGRRAHGPEQAVPADAADPPRSGAAPRLRARLLQAPGQLEAAQEDRGAALHGLRVAD